ncbi:hypothetical protein [Pseudomonas sp.]|uniref:hypothetical protein n=1 Tax=Pseudomonas sp. TaxID=306 RepID=UPI002731DFF2|nr:hypothetical protein [Pseudomonas sp.]MDP2244010.1 hypothetical protein [Pseudomonas sp.]
MATLQEQRQAIAAGMAASRAPTAEAERKAIGKRIIEERTGKAVVEDLNRLTTPARQRSSLRPVGAVGALPASVGRGVYQEPAATTGGIASPLAEDVTLLEGKYYPDREYWPEGHTSSDGLFVLPAIKILNLRDANDAVVQIFLADPEGTIE